MGAWGRGGEREARLEALGCSRGEGASSDQGGFGIEASRWFEGHHSDRFGS